MNALLVAIFFMAAATSASIADGTPDQDFVVLNLKVEQTYHIRQYISSFRIYVNL